jgi:opacity protein-like surface antigen
MITSTRLLSLAMLLAAFGNAHSAERGFYLGLAYSNVSPDYATPEMVAYPDAGISATDTPSFVTGDAVEPIGSNGIKGLVGYRVYDWLAFEVDYLRLDGNSAPMNLVCVTQPCPDKVQAESSNYSFSVLGLWPIGRFDVFARAGVSRWDSKISLLTSDEWRYWSEDLTGTEAKYGAGAQMHIDKVTARLEYEHLRFGGDAADTWSIGIAYGF